jgi:YjbE family integral membrane protein
MDTGTTTSFSLHMLTEPEFWFAIGQIIMIDILLGGDNAVVIALACRRLPLEQRTKAIFWGTFGAIGLRVVLLFFAIALLKVSFLKIIGGLLLLWIGVKLLIPESTSHHGKIDAGTNLVAAIKTIIVADAVMSLDNVVAVAGAARDSMVLVAFGIIISVPIIVWGSQLVLKLMDRFPIIITLGAALLGYIAGEMVVSDRVTEAWVEQNATWLHYGAPIIGALLVVILGKLLARRFQPQSSLEDLAAQDRPAEPVD